MTEPSGALLATLIAATKLAPEEMPQKIPFQLKSKISQKYIN